MAGLGRGGRTKLDKVAGAQPKAKANNEQVGDAIGPDILGNLEPEGERCDSKRRTRKDEEVPKDQW